MDVQVSFIKQCRRKPPLKRCLFGFATFDTFQGDVEPWDDLIMIRIVEILLLFDTVEEDALWSCT